LWELKSDAEKSASTIKKPASTILVVACTNQDASCLVSDINISHLRQLSGHCCYVGFRLHFGCSVNSKRNAPKYIVVCARWMTVSDGPVISQEVFFHVEFGAYVSAVGAFPFEQWVEELFVHHSLFE
jgi:hypothetical protein